MIAKKRAPIRLAIVGSGIAGYCTALYASQIQNPDGSPAFDITLLEGQKHTLNGQSLVGFHAHIFGYEYVMDRAHTPEGFEQTTGAHCMKGGAVLRLVMPDNIYMYSNMAFGVTRETERSGRLTVEDYHAYAQEQQERYRDILKKLTRRRGINMAQAEKLLWGPPQDSRNSTLSDIDLKMHPSVAGGFYSREPNMNIPSYLSALEDALRRQENVTLHTGYRVIKDGIRPSGSQYIIHSEGHRPIVTDIVVMAAGEHNPELSEACRNGPLPTIYRRALLALDISPLNQIIAKNPTLENYSALLSIFMVEGKSGGMFLPCSTEAIKGKIASASVGIAYVPGVAYLGEKKLTPQDRSVPDEWNRPLPPHEEQRKMHEYYKALVDRFPFLRHAQPLNLLVRNTINFQNDVTMRRNRPPIELTRNLYALYASKMTVGPWVAATMARILDESLERGLDSHRLLTGAGAERAMTRTFDEVLEGQHSLRDILHPNIAGANRFSRAHPEIPRFLSIPSVPSSFSDRERERTRKKGGEMPEGREF